MVEGQEARERMSGDKGLIGDPDFTGNRTDAKGQALPVGQLDASPEAVHAGTTRREYELLGELAAAQIIRTADRTRIVALEAQNARLLNQLAAWEMFSLSLHADQQDRAPPFTHGRMACVDGKLVVKGVYGPIPDSASEDLLGPHLSAPRGLPSCP
jgi:hypothetical protein